MSTLVIDKKTIKKFDVAGPRYTSYPTAPEWTADVNGRVYQQKLAEFGKTDKTLSIYIHIPFCRSMCYFCACNVVIRRPDEKYGAEYLDYVFKEIEIVARHIGKKNTVKQFHLGGGTPNFLTAEQLTLLFHKVAEHFKIDFNGEIAIEVDPRTVDFHKISTLKKLGFNRISMGIQDFDSKVQETINRIQPLEKVRELFGWCRDLKFHSVNCDLIYGLPYQTPESFYKTVEKVIDLRPDRIALYSFAHVPWLKKHQTKLDPGSLPTNDQKLDIFLQSRNQFLKNGYQAIAMDHFALEADEMARAFNEGALYRNFMGYTVKPADEYIGLGVSSIGFLENTYIQNVKTIQEYYERLKEGELPVERGKVLAADDQIRQWVINSLMCRFHVDKTAFQKRFNVSFDEYFAFEKAHVEKCAEEYLLTISPDVIMVAELGRIFIRNICMNFDWYLRQENAHKRFSRTV